MLTVEDGTGVENANSYITVEDVENYFMGDRLAQFQALPPDKKEEALIDGSRLVDITYDWIGGRMTAEQGLSWPRLNVWKDGFPADGVPAAVKKASCEAAFIAMTGGELYSDENGREIASESEGGLSRSYVSGADKGRPAVSKYEILDKLLKGFYRTDTLGAPSSVGFAHIIRG